MELFKLFGKIVIENTEANDEIDETKKKAQDTSNSMSSAFKKIGGAVATYLTVGAIKDFGAGCLTAAADANAASSQFSQVFGDLEGNASKSLSGIADEAGISENRMKGSFTKIAAFAKTTGMDTETALALSERAMVAVADSAAFYDRSLEDTTESLQSFLKGNYENDAALGLSCTETTRNAAANKLYGKSFKDLSEEQKQLTLLQMVEDANKASGALGQAARESDTWTNVTGNLKQSWNDFQAVLGANILPTAVGWVKNLAEFVAGLAEKVPAVVAWFQQYSGVLAGVAAAIGTVVAGVTLYNTVTAVKLAMDAAEVTTLGALIALKLQAAAATIAMYAPYIAIAAAIAAVIAIGVLLYKNWDEIKAKAGELAEKAKEKFEEMKEAASEKFEAMKEKMGTIMQAAKDTVNEKLNNMKEAYNEHGGGIMGIAAAAIEGVKGYYSAGFTFIDNLTGGKLSEVANKVKTKMSEAKAAVADRISSIKSSFSSGLSSALGTVTEKFNSIKTKISSIMDNAKNLIKSAIDKIAGFFSGANWSLPKIKLPHISISGSFSINPPRVPSFGISWYKKAYDNAMILNDPTIFGYSPASGKFLGGGDGNGGEVVSGASTLMNMIQTAVAEQNEALVYYLQKIIQMLADFFPRVLESLMNMDIVLDDGTLVGRLAPAIDMELGRIKDRKDRGR